MKVSILKLEKEMSRISLSNGIDVLKHTGVTEVEGVIILKDSTQINFSFQILSKVIEDKTTAEVEQFVKKLILSEGK